MKRGMLVLVLLLAAALAFANPFVGTWELQGTDGRIILVVEEARFTSYQNGEMVASKSGAYTVTDCLLVTNGVPWLYYFLDVNHFGLVGWLMIDGTVQPVLMIWGRVAPSGEIG